MMRANCRFTGFVLPVVMGIILIAALIAVQATTELGSATLLATQRQLHQQAFAAAENGVVTVLEQLASGTAPAAPQTLQAGTGPGESVTVATNITSRTALAAGFSADRILETHYEIRSTGHGVRGSEVTVVQGAHQLTPVATP